MQKIKFKIIIHEGMYIAIVPINCFAMLGVISYNFDKYRLVALCIYIYDFLIIFFTCFTLPQIDLIVNQNINKFSHKYVHNNNVNKIFYF